METEIIWNQNNKSKSGKMIPMEVNGQNHNCAFRPKYGNQVKTETEPVSKVGEFKAQSEERTGAETSELKAAYNRLETDLLRTRDLVTKQTEILERIEKNLAIMMMTPKA